MANDYTPTTWASAVLQKLGYTPTPGAVKALSGWAQAEGGHWKNQARYNPLNTTQPEPGAGNTGSQGNIKVYRSWDQGIDATVKTLQNGRYGGILAGLKVGDANAVANAIGQSPWGTSGGLVRQTIGAAKAVVPQAPPVMQAQAPATTTTTPGVDNSQMRRGLIANFLSSGGVKSTGATQALAAGWVNAQDVPGTSTTTQAPAASAAPSTTPRTPSGSTPSGVVKFEGKPVAAWIAPALQYARQHGWSGTVNSGFRSYADQQRIWDSGVRPAARPGTSNHEGSDFPRGAVDVSNAAQLAQILQRSPYASKLVWAGAKDPVHFSHPHNGSY